MILPAAHVPTRRELLTCLEGSIPSTSPSIHRYHTDLIDDSSVPAITTVGLPLIASRRPPGRFGTRRRDNSAGIVLRSGETVAAIDPISGLISSESSGATLLS